MQFTAPSLMANDARFKPGYDPHWWRDHHPTTLERLAYATAVTSDLERAKHIYVDVFGGKLLHELESPLTGTSNAYVALGETVIELAMPTRQGTYASDDLERNGEMHHAVTFKVTDLEQADKYLATKGVKSVARDEQTILYDPDTTMGAFFRLTTWSVP
jgi:catechol 2,3-dioxygenase-like lactoylglutathione lyase family enzyme